MTREAGVTRAEAAVRRRFRPMGLLALLVLGVGPAAAQETVSADRPGLDFSPVTVSPGFIQLEVGLPTLSLETATNGDTWLFQTPVLARVGLTGRLEVRAGLSPYNSLSTPRSGDSDAETKTGAGDLEVGAKVRLTNENSSVAIVAIPSLFLPTGSGEFAGGAVGYLLNTVVGFSLADAVGVAVTGGLYDLPDGDDRSTSGLAAVTVARSLSSVVGLFAETGLFPGPGRDPSQLGGGVTLLLSPNVQLDASVSGGLNEATPDWQFGSGIAFRF